jgi:hypothetical protein
VRRNQALAETGRATILKISRFEAEKTMDLRLDLGWDVVVLGSGAEEGGGGIGEDDWGEGEADGVHVVFSAAGRIGVRWQGGGRVCFHGLTGREGGGGMEGELEDGWHGAEGRGFTGLSSRREDKAGFCALCVAGMLRRFDDLREVYLIVDGVNEREGWGCLGEDEEMDVEAMEVLKAPPQRVFSSYRRTYFSLENPGRRREVNGPVAALHAIRESLVRGGCL